MAVELLCPECESILTAPDDVLGEIVRCEECHSSFTAKKRVQQLLLEEESDRPRIQKLQEQTARFRRSLLIGVLVVGVLPLLIFGTAFFANLTPKSARSAKFHGDVRYMPATLGMQKIRISHSQVIPVRDLNDPFHSVFSDSCTIDFEFISGDPYVGQYYVRCRFDDGITNESHLNGLLKTMRNRGTLSLTTHSNGRPSIEIWIEENSVDASGVSTRTSVSNTISRN